jgi:hypothetical protein
MIKTLKHRLVHGTFGFIMTLLSVKYEILKKLSILFTLRESGCSREQQDTPISGVAKGSHVDGCCFAAAYGIRPWTSWIWDILDFRSIRVSVLTEMP